MANWSLKSKTIINLFWWQTKFKVKKVCITLNIQIKFMHHLILMYISSVAVKLTSVLDGAPVAYVSS